ncbi:hypothetical protein [Actinocorallia herbida]|nr:hypothetical protein [Actinocorallia herbida]
MGRGRAQPVTVGILRRSYPEVVSIWWGKATCVWRALVHVDGLDTWAIGETLDRLGNALWALLRGRHRLSAPPRSAAGGRPVASVGTVPALPEPPVCGADAPVPPASASRRAVPVPNSLGTDDYWPGVPARRDPGPRRPGLLVRFGGRVRGRRAAA